MNIIAAPSRSYFVGALLWAYLTLAVSCVGCSRSGEPYPVNADLASQSLTTFLERWKSGQAAASLRQESPPITGVDSAWEAGQKLVGYKVVRKTSDGRNLHVIVELDLKDGKGQTKKGVATYIVGTSPAITVFPE